MDRKAYISLAEKIIDGHVPDPLTYRELAGVPDVDVMKMLPGADLLREHYFGKSIHLCTICNGKSGKCSEDCRFCAQSAHYRTDAAVYPLMGKEKLVEAGITISRTPVHRFSVVTTGRGLPAGEVAVVAQALEAVKAAGIRTCASLGILGEEALKVLRAAGVDRYHHNLEAAESRFSEVCGTHTFEARVETIRRAGRLGFSVCAGGIFGIGETDEQVLELAMTLKTLAVWRASQDFSAALPEDHRPVPIYAAGYRNNYLRGKGSQSERAAPPGVFCRRQRHYDRQLPDRHGAETRR